MSTSKNSLIKGDLTIQSADNTGDIGSGILFTNFLKETTLDSGITIGDSVLDVNSIEASALVKLTNDVSESVLMELNSSTNSSNGGVRSFRLINESGSTLIKSKGNRGIIISETSGNILVESTSDAVNTTTAGLVVSGGISTVKSAIIGTELSALDGYHQFTNTQSTESVLKITNSSTGGFSSINLTDDVGSTKFTIGYGNSTTSSPYTSQAYIQSTDSTLFRNNSVNSLNIRSTGVVEIFNNTSSTTSTSGSFLLNGGLSISNTTDAISSVNGGSITSAGGMAIAKKLYVGSNAYINGVLDMNNNRIINLGTPQLDSDATSKIYVDSIVEDLRIKKNVKVATTVALVLATDFESGDIVDGITLSQNDRILIKNQSNGVENGIYTVNSSGSPTRVDDLPSGSSAASIFTIVQTGTVNADTLWICSNNSGTDIVNTDALTFVQIQGGGGGGGNDYYAGTGLTLSGTTFSVNSSQTQVTELGTITTGAWTASTITVPYGGTGATSFTATSVLLGNGTSPIYPGSGITYATSTLTLPKITSNDTTATTSSTTGSILVSGGIGISNTTDATSSTNGGTLTTAGGMAIAKKLFVGTDLSIGGNVTSGTWTASTITVPYGGSGATSFTATGVLLGNGTSPIYPGSGITYATSTLTLPKITSNDTTATTSSTTGSILVSGGIGISNTTDAVSSTNGGTLTTAGGMAIAKKLFVGTDLSIGGNVTSGTWTASTITVPYGGSGATSFTATGVLLGNGTSPIYPGSGITYATSTLTLPKITSNDTTATTSSTTGSILVSGGIGISNTTDATSSINGGTITTAGGMAIAKKLFVGTDLSIGGNVTSGTWTASTITVPYGGTGATSFTATGVLLGNGTSPIYPGSGITYDASTLTLPKITSNDATATTSSTTGSILLSGGIGISNTTDATSSINGGTLTTAGGMAIAKKLFVGTDLSIGGNVTTGTWTASTITVPYGGSGATSFTATGVLLGNGTSPIYPGSGITYATSTLTLPKITSNDATATTSSTTGSILLSGGIGISNTTDAVSSTNGGTLTTAGGMAIAKKLFVGTDLSIGRYTRMFSSTAPSNPGSGYEFYIDNSDNFLKSKNSSGVVKTYNPMTTKGDLITHNGSTDVKLPVGSENQILYVTSSVPEGISWRNLSNDTAPINPNINKYFESYNSSSTTLTGTYSNVPLDTIRTTDVDYFSYTNSEITFLSSGRYIIIGKLTIEGVSGNNGTYASLIIQSGSNNSFTTVSGSISYAYKVNTSKSGVCSCNTCVILTLTEDDQVRLQMRRESGSDTIQTSPNSCNLVVVRVSIDEIDDNSKYINTYKTSNQSLTGSFSDISFNTNRIIDTAYTHTSGSAEITFEENGIYLVIAGIGFQKTAGTSHSETESDLQLSDTNGSNYATIGGSLNYCYFKTNGAYHSAVSYCIINVSVGQRIKMRSRVSVSNNVSALQDSCYFNIFKFQSTSTSQTNVKTVDIYNTGSQSIGTSYTDITYNTQRLINGIYSHIVNSAEISVDEAGKYIILFKMCTNNTSSNSNDESVSQARILLNTGNGYSAISGHLSATPNIFSTAGKGTIAMILTLTLPAGSLIKAQGIRYSGSGTIVTVANTTGMSIVKVEPEEEIVDSLLKFGTYYSQAESSGISSTTSTSYIQKLRLTTALVPQGIYRIGWNWVSYPSNNSTVIYIRLLIDNTEIQEITEDKRVNALTPGCVFKQYSLLSGIHNIDIEYRSDNGSTVSIKDTRIEFWRLS